MNSGLDNAGKSTFLESAKTRFVKDYKARDMWLRFFNKYHGQGYCT